MNPDITLINVDNLHVATYLKPLEKVGGDYFSFSPIRKDKYSLVMADAVGHGRKANHIVKEIEMELKKQADLIEMPSVLCKILQETELKTKPSEFSDSTYTGFFGLLNMANNTFTYSSAGHNEQFKYDSRRDSIEKLESTGIILGVNLPGIIYEQVTIPFVKGDKLLLYTDGVSEIFNQKKEEFGAHRVESALSRFRQSGPSKIIKNILSERKSFLGNRVEEMDDVSIAVIA